MIRALAGLALAGWLAVAGAQAPQAPAASRPERAEALFATGLFDLEEKPVTMDALRGTPLIVNFWARWCGPCRVEIPELIKANARYKARGLQILGIAIEDRGEPVRDFAKAYEMDYRLLLAKDKGIPLMRALGNDKAGLPFTIAVGRDGRVVAFKLGVMKPADIEAAAEAALK